MTYKTKLPNYFTKQIRGQMGKLYASSAIADFALAIVMLFEPIFLYSVVGLSVPQVLLFMGLIYAVYIVAIPFGAKFSSKLGYEYGILASIPFQILFWVTITLTAHNHWYLIIAPIIYGIEKALFWPAFHAIIAQFARTGQQGREFSVLHAIINFMFVIGPLVGGFIADKFGLSATFFIAAIIYSISFVPLFLSRKKSMTSKFEFKQTLALYHLHPKKFFGYLGFGEELLVLTVWPIFIYKIVSDYTDTGVLATLAALVATIIGLYVGKLTDQTRGKSGMIRVATIFYVAVWFLRLVANSFFSLFAIDSLSRITKDMVFIPLSAVTYERAEASNIMAYVVFFEQSLSIGKLLAVGLGYAIFISTGSFLAIFVLAAFFSLLYMLI